MSSQSAPPLEICAKQYCNVTAQLHGLDPAGHARAFDDAILVETPLPWKRDLYEKAGALPQAMVDLLALWRTRYQAGEPYNHLPLLIAPDPAYSQPGYRRVIFFYRQPGPMVHYERLEYLAPEAEVGPLIWALYEAQDERPRFEQYRVLADAPKGRPLRDLLVCTHGTVDVACAKFGYPLYQHLRSEYANDNLRIWRVSHFGGHVFAPTLLDMPTGHYWAYISEAQAEQLVAQHGDVADLRGHYRGWAGMAGGFAQAAECAAWQREGWAWFDYAKCGEVIEQDSSSDMPKWAKVQIAYHRPDGTTGCFAAHVDMTHNVETKHSTAQEQPHPYAQYAVADPVAEVQMQQEPGPV